MTASARWTEHSGIPMKWQAWKALTATPSAFVSARPTSSEAKRVMRRATYRGSSPPSSMRASQYTAAFGSELRIDLCSAEMML